MISILGPANENYDNSPEKILEIAKGGKKIVQEFAKESEIVLNKIKKGSVFGYYYRVTDKAPQLPPDEYRYLTQGIIALQDLIMNFSIFTNEKNIELEKRVIEMFGNANYTPPSSSPSIKGPTNIENYFTYPGKTWSLVVDVTDFKMNPNQMRDAGLGIMASGYNEELGLMITIFIEEKEFEGDALKYREYYLKMDKKSPLIKTETKLYERGELAVYEYFVPTYQGETINQRHFNAILTREDTWIDVHMSKVEFKQEDWKYFEKVLDSIHIAK
jgi:hypothetical protein